MKKNLGWAPEYRCDREESDKQNKEFPEKNQSQYTAVHILHVIRRFR